MAQLADGFLALPGGLGTLEELAEVLSWAQLGLNAKPVGALDVGRVLPAARRPPRPRGAQRASSRIAIATCCSWTTTSSGCSRHSRRGSRRGAGSTEGCPRAFACR